MGKFHIIGTIYGVFNMKGMGLYWNNMESDRCTFQCDLSIKAGWEGRCWDCEFIGSSTILRLKSSHVLSKHVLISGPNYTKKSISMLFQYWAPQFMVPSIFRTKKVSGQQKGFVAPNLSSKALGIWVCLVGCLWIHLTSIIFRIKMVMNWREYQ